MYVGRRVGKHEGMRGRRHVNYVRKRARTYVRMFSPRIIPRARFPGFGAWPHRARTHAKPRLEGAPLRQEAVQLLRRVVRGEERLPAVHQPAPRPRGWQHLSGLQRNGGGRAILGTGREPGETPTQTNVIGHTKLRRRRTPQMSRYAISLAERTAPQSEPNNTGAKSKASPLRRSSPLALFVFYWSEQVFTDFSSRPPDCLPSSVVTSWLPDVLPKTPCWLKLQHGRQESTTAHARRRKRRSGATTNTKERRTTEMEGTTIQRSAPPPAPQPRRGPGRPMRPGGACVFFVGERAFLLAACAGVRPLA